MGNSFPKEPLCFQLNHYFFSGEHGQIEKIKVTFVPRYKNDSNIFCCLNFVIFACFTSFFGGFPSQFNKFVALLKFISPCKTCTTLKRQGHITRGQGLPFEKQWFNLVTTAWTFSFKKWPLKCFRSLIIFKLVLCSEKLSSSRQK